MARSFALLALAATGALGCASAAQRVYIAPSTDTVLTTLEEGRGDMPAHLIWVENRSSVLITVYSVALRNCENIRQACEPRPVNVTVQPGQRRMVLRVDPRSPNLGSTFGYSFAWRPAAGT